MTAQNKIKDELEKWHGENSVKLNGDCPRGV